MLTISRVKASLCFPVELLYSHCTVQAAVNTHEGQAVILGYSVIYSKAPFSPTLRLFIGVIWKLICAPCQQFF